MLFGKKNKKPENVDISKLSFLSTEAKEAFKILGLDSTAQIRGKNAEDIYLDYCVESGGVADRCILFEMRAAVYYADTSKPDPKKLRWWYWKDSNTDNEELFND